MRQFYFILFFFVVFLSCLRLKYEEQQQTQANTKKNQCNAMHYKTQTKHNDFNFNVPLDQQTNGATRKHTHTLIR